MTAAAKADKVVEVWECSRKGGCGFTYSSPIPLIEMWHKCHKGDSQRRALQKRKDK